MHHRTTALTVMALLWAGGARAQGTSLEFPVDLVAPLDGRAIAELNGAAGPIVLHQVIVQNVPPAEELASATPKDRARPKPLLLFDNVSRSDARITVTVQLEDEAGVVLMSCRIAKSASPAWKEADDEICEHRESLATRDWPRVKFVRVVGTVLRMP